MRFFQLNLPSVIFMPSPLHLELDVHTIRDAIKAWRRRGVVCSLTYELAVLIKTSETPMHRLPLPTQHIFSSDSAGISGFWTNMTQFGTKSDIHVTNKSLHTQTLAVDQPGILMLGQKAKHTYTSIVVRCVNPYYDFPRIFYNI